VGVAWGKYEIQFQERGQAADRDCNSRRNCGCGPNRLGFLLGDVPVSFAYQIDNTQLRRLIKEKRAKEKLSWYRLTCKLGISKGALTHFMSRDRSSLSLPLFISVVMWLADDDLPEYVETMQALIVERPV
jgi:hypothetical protein